MFAHVKASLDLFPLVICSENPFEVLTGDCSKLFVVKGNATADFLGQVILPVIGWLGLQSLLEQPASSCMYL